MNEKIQIALSSTEGNLINLCPNKTDTLRSVLKLAKIGSLPNTQIICFLKEAQLKLDLSLDIQGVRNNDTIFVFHKKISRSRHKRASHPLEVFASLYQKSRQYSNQQNSVYLESLKINDNYFISFDYYKNSAKIYTQILKQQQEKYVIKEVPTEKLIISDEIKDQVSCDPLPVCFKSDLEAETDEDSDSMIPHMGKFRTYSDVVKTHDETNLQS